MSALRSISIAGLVFTATTAVMAQAPSSLALIGRVDSMGAPPTSPVDLEAALYDTSGALVWNETLSGVVTDSGRFSVTLGSTVSLDPVSFAQPLELGVTTGSDEETVPRIPLGASAYALSLRGLRVVPNQAPDGPNLIGGHVSNSISGGSVGVTVGGGGSGSSPNTVGADFSTVGGGLGNAAPGNTSTVQGGRSNAAVGVDASIGGGSANSAHGEGSIIRGGRSHATSADFATVGGGGPFGGPNGHRIYDHFGFVGGGVGNVAGFDDADPLISDYATVIGGIGNQARGAWSSVGAGQGNIITSEFGEHSSILGGEGNEIELQLAGIGGGFQNKSAGAGSFVFGGAENVAAFPDVGHAEHLTVMGGVRHQVVGTFSTIVGGDNNRVGTDASPVDFATIRGGISNSADEDDATVSGGAGNHVYTGGNHASILGGDFNQAEGSYSAVLGGWANWARGDYSLSAGRTAEATHNGSFVWGDSSISVFESDADAQFIIDADGGVGIGTDNPLELLHVAGISLATDHTTPSDGRWKTSIRPIEDALGVVESLRGVTFKWNEQAAALGAAVGERSVGFIAQEVLPVLPEAVVGESTGLLSVSYERLVAVLVEAVKEQEMQLRRLEAAAAGASHSHAEAGEDNQGRGFSHRGRGGQ